MLSTHLSRLEDHGKAYTAADFDGHVVYFGYQDNTPPEFELLLKIIAVADGWLQKDKKNVVAVHCLAGWVLEHITQNIIT